MSLKFPSEDPQNCEGCLVAIEKNAFLVQSNAHAICYVPHRYNTEGSLVVQPIRHVNYLCELSTEESLATFDLAVHCLKAVEKYFAPDGANFWWDAGEIAGQAVAHFQIEIVPRYVDDAYRFSRMPDRSVHVDGERARVAEALKRTLGEI